MKATTVNFTILASVLLLSAAFLGAIVPNINNENIVGEQYVKTVDFDTPIQQIDPSAFEKFTEYDLSTNDDGSMTFVGSTPSNPSDLSTEQMKNEKTNNDKNHIDVKLKTSSKRTSAEGSADVYQDGELLETVSFIAWSVPDDVLFSIGGVTYSVKEVQLQEGVEECFAFLIVLIPVIVAVLAPIIVPLVVVAVVAAIAYVATGYIIEQKEKYNDGSEKTVAKLKVNFSDNTAEVDGVKYNLVTIQSSNPQTGKYYFAAINTANGFVYISTVSISEQAALSIMKIELTADLIGVYSLKEMDARNIALRAANLGADLVGPENHYFNNTNKGYYYDHYHKSRTNHIHAFFGFPKIRS
ncbi:hypothetical protein Mpt1_c13840 [Candidatus Methanoplasma termitum]|uniref:Uncharacterized protein n=1 Tax=Candidatus Methanoplasma termitum TaxID=1577791 RepID=A0A0A7LDJ2_9ARCH|nr:hypothetical protein [Candidatus Methanoplasma termitum]AIZ57245.1 hypothetical protein Mpt1_c13840 [Candidatus Methanoplasma termitum]